MYTTVSNKIIAKKQILKKETEKTVIFYMGIREKFAVEKSALDFFDSLRRRPKISNSY